MNPTEQTIHETVNCISIIWTPSPAEEINWFIYPHAIQKFNSTFEDCLILNFSFQGIMTEKKALSRVNEVLHHYKVQWIKNINSTWIINIEELYKTLPNLPSLDWLKGKTIPIVEVEYLEDEIFGSTKKKTSVKFSVTQSSIKTPMHQKIFLSHKGIDKPQVRRYKLALETVGFSPWLDEDAMVAGVELERGLLQGFKESCAAVFFVTPNYQDTGFLATEVNYAIREKRDKGDKFSIITLALPDDNGGIGQIPDLLQQYVWKQPESELEAYCEIIHALPLKIAPPQWR